MNRPSCNGYIMILSLIIVSGIMLLVNYLFQQGQTHIAFVHTMVNREKAKLLALSGVNIALSQLQGPVEKKKKKGEVEVAKKPQEKVKDKNYLFLERIFPVINRWQTFNFQKKKDGMEGIIRVSISCEDGKLNLNKLFDFNNKKFKGAGLIKGNIQESMKSLMAQLKEWTKKDLSGALLDFLVKRGYQLNEVTELLEKKEYDFFSDSVFYEPPVAMQEKRSVYLTDIFTIWSDTMMIEPWFLSDSLCALLGLKRAAPDEITKRKQLTEKLATQFKKQFNWATDWDKIFKEIYGKPFNALPKGVDFLLNKEFNPKVFSVISHGTCERVTQRVFAIIEKEQNEEKKGKNSSDIFVIKKLYWI